MRKREENTMRVTRFTLLVAVVCGQAAAQAPAQEAVAPDEFRVAQAASEASPGAAASPSTQPHAAEGRYSGSLWSRSTMTGDWGDVRNTLATKGITFDASLTQVEQGVVGGGKNGRWEDGGRGNLTTNVDTEKLGLWPGGFLTLEVEGNFADSVNRKTGALMSVNTNQLFPKLPSGNFNVPQLSFAQFLSPYAGVALGKFDTMSSDANEFAHGKGDTQFFNLAFNINPVTLVAPYSPLGVGLIALPTQDPDAAIVNFFVLQAKGKASTSGFENLRSDELLFAGEGRVRTDFFGLTGHQLVGAGYSNRQFTSLDQRLQFDSGNRTLAKKDGSWNVYYNFDQFLYETRKGSGQGVGLFGRFGAADGNPNPLQYFFSAGIGGKGIISSRPLDRFGIGYYYINVASPTLQGLRRTRSFLGDEWGVEVFYDLAITPWMLLTPDLQVIGPSQKRQSINSIINLRSIDTATVLGVRLQLVF